MGFPRQKLRHIPSSSPDVTVNSIRRYYLLRKLHFVTTRPPWGPGFCCSRPRWFPFPVTASRPEPPLGPVWPHTECPSAVPSSHLGNTGDFPWPSSAEPRRGSRQPPAVSLIWLWTRDRFTSPTPEEPGVLVSMSPKGKRGRCGTVPVTRGATCRVRWPAFSHIVPPYAPVLTHRALPHGSWQGRRKKEEKLPNDTISDLKCQPQLNTSVYIFFINWDELSFA